MSTKDEIENRTDDLVEKIFEIIKSEAKRGGISPFIIGKELKRKYKIELKSGFSNIVSMCERRGYLLYLDGTKLLPYKNINTGERFDDENIC